MKASIFVVVVNLSHQKCIKLLKKVKNLLLLIFQIMAKIQSLRFAPLLFRHQFIKFDAKVYI
jgi:hypothetical protein